MSATISAVNAASLSGQVILATSGVAGVTVKLVNAAGTIIETFTTDSSGAYAFTGLAAGSYQVQYVSPKGDVLETGSQAATATGLTPAVTLAAGQSVALAAEVLLSNPATIDGMIHRYGAGDPVWGVGAAGVVVTLLNSAGVALATATTTTGWFAFAGLAAGTYQLRYAPPAGEVIQPGSSADPATGLTTPVTVTAGQTLAVATGAVVPTGSVSGAVTLAGAGKAGVTVALLDVSGTAIATTTTGSTGSFTFAALNAGTYQVQYTPPAGNGLLASGAANATTGLTAPISLSAGQALSLPAEGLTGPTSITGTVVYQGAGQAGVAVGLLNTAGTVVATTATSNTGSFNFTGIAPGSYQVQYTPPAGERLQATTAGAAFATTAASTASTVPSITLIAGQNLVLAAQTLASLPATINGSVLHFGAAIDPTGGSGEAGVGVALLNASGAVTATTVSNASGVFNFTNVAAGTYTLDYTLPSGQNFESGSGVSLSTGLSSSFTVAAGATVSTPNVAVESSINTAALHLTFDDEFNSFVSSPDGSVGWMTSYPYGGESARALPLNGEAEYYSDSSVGENPFSISNGVLDITATQAAAGSNPYNLPYDSGLATTYKSFSQLYGYFEVRAELPAGQGFWPAFWLLPANNSGAAELDVFEVLGNATSTEYETTHGTAANGSYAGQQQVVNTVNSATGFHTYGVDWEPTAVTFYIDGNAVSTLPTPASMDTPMYMLLNLAVGAQGSWPGAPNATTPFPATMQVDYARAYATANTVDVGGTAALGTITGNVTVATVGAPGVTVSLLAPSGMVIATTTTSSSGSFTFNSVSAGAYQVQYTPPASEVLQAGGPANTTTGLTSSVTLGAGQTLALAAETLAPAVGTFTGNVVYAGAGQAGVAMALLNTAGATVATATTGSTGAFSFANVPVGSYQVLYTAPAGEAPNATGPANALTGLTSALTLTAGQVVSLGTETLIPAFGTVQGTVHHFGSADPVWGSPQSDVGVALVNAAGATVASTVTTWAGWFSFTHVADGTYNYVYTLPAGEAFQAGGPVNTATGVSTSFVVTAGSNQFTPMANVISSSNSFTLNGTGAIALRSDGNYTVTGNASGGTLTLGNGNDSVNLTGGGDTITVGAGNSTITALGANNLITVGPGMSFITADSSAGNKFVTLAAGQGLETISGFTPGDILGLSRTLTGLNVANDLSNLGSYVTAVTTGGDTTLLVTPNGSGSASAFAQLTGVKTTVAALISGHNVSLT